MDEVLTIDDRKPRKKQGLMIYGRILLVGVLTLVIVF